MLVQMLLLRLKFEGMQIPKDIIRMIGQAIKATETNRRWLWESLTYLSIDTVEKWHGKYPSLKGLTACSACVNAALWMEKYHRYFAKPTDCTCRTICERHCCFPALGVDPIQHRVCVHCLEDEYQCVCNGSGCSATVSYKKILGGTVYSGSRLCGKPVFDSDDEDDDESLMLCKGHLSYCKRHDQYYDKYSPTGCDRCYVEYLSDSF
jgi:hypothetical protein